MKNPLSKRLRIQPLPEDSTRKGQDGLAEAMSSVTKIPMYDGEDVLHGYSLKYVGNPDRCPRCGGSTEQRYADWIYSTRGAPRIMAAPAGYFCLECDTVIVDEEMIEMGVQEPYHFQHVGGIGREDHPNLFRTWNGERTIYILGEDGEFEDMVTEADIGRLPSAPRTSLPRPPKRPGQRSRKKKLAKQSRKRNRRCS